MTDEPAKKTYDTQRVPPDFVDGTMTRSEIAAVLEAMPFPQRRRRADGQSLPLELDIEVRDFLLTLLRHRP